MLSCSFSHGLREGPMKLGARQCKVSHIPIRCDFDFGPGILVRDNAAKRRLKAQVGEIAVILSVPEFLVFFQLLTSF